MTAFSSGADLVARVSTRLEPGARVLVPTGVWIQDVLWTKVPEGFVPELQVRARSSLSLKRGLMLANGVGTIDADFRQEIQVMLYNASAEAVALNAGERIAQLVCQLVAVIPGLKRGQARVGGFGSTGTGVDLSRHP